MQQVSEEVPLDSNRVQQQRQEDDAVTNSTQKGEDATAAAVEEKDWASTPIHNLPVNLYSPYETKQYHTYSKETLVRLCEMT